MSSKDNSTDRKPMTTLEPVEAIRAQIRPKTVQERLHPADNDASSTLPFRPTNRPPMALLLVLDDGEKSAEQVRIRSTPFVIGRTEGDAVIPHDTQISSRHAQIERLYEYGNYGWHLKDLGSANGIFARVSHVVLKHEHVLRIGSKRYRFDLGFVDDSGQSEGGKDAGSGTRLWQQVSDETIAKFLPSLVELTTEGDGNRVTIDGDEQWIGRDANQSSIVLDDQMVDPRHARFYRDTQGRWCVESPLTLNGLWAQIDDVPIIKSAQFQCGEQLFILRILENQ
jgi:pSer/pThr/pTyr-binding forkhead associated (FHA) protein